MPQSALILGGKAAERYFDVALIFAAKIGIEYSAIVNRWASGLVG
jgi:hypothetical protein